jgi:hypothetical protein
MKHISNPLETVWYYVRTYNHYFPYIEHRPNGILLDGSMICGKSFTAPFESCRIADYEEVRKFYNR